MTETVDGAESPQVDENLRSLPMADGAMDSLAALNQEIAEQHTLRQETAEGLQQWADEREDSPYDEKGNRIHGQVGPLKFSEEESVKLELNPENPPLLIGRNQKPFNPAENERDVFEPPEDPAISYTPHPANYRHPWR